ncbi:MAG TPA: type II secretion system F family protein [Terriglobales bacterium]|nr:type II secretion system F family protein [Terriglobales bacterium]
MAEFVIKMADDRGRTMQQVEHGYSEAEVRDRFAQQGFLVYSVKARGMFAGGEMTLGRRRKVKQSDFIIFNQQFLTLIHAGLPVLNSLDLLIKRQRNASLQTLLDNVRDRVKSGEALSDAFAAQGAFPKLYTTTLLAGEKSGNIEEVLGRYIAFQRMTASFRKKLAVSLVYPALLVVVVVIMLTFLVTYVVPQFAELFSSLNAQLPSITVFMLSVGTFARKYIVLVVVALTVLIFLMWRWKNTDRGAAQIDRVVLSLPLLGQIVLKQQVATFARTLSTLLQGGLPLVPAMETAGTSMSSRRIVNGIADATVSVREGQTLSKSLEEEEIFPDLAVEMIEVGESTGALPAMLVSVAEFYEEDVQTALGAMMALIEPIILIFMAIFVGGVLASLYLPIFSLGSSGIH